MPAAELKQERDQQEQCGAQLEQVQAEMSLLRQELEGVRMAAAMSEQAKSDEVASIRGHYEQEISSMQHLLGGKDDHNNNKNNNNNNNNGSLARPYLS